MGQSALGAVSEEMHCLGDFRDDEEPTWRVGGGCGVRLLLRYADWLFGSE